MTVLQDRPFKLEPESLDLHTPGMERPAPEDIQRTFAEPCAETRGCEVPGCPEDGLYRAPVSRRQLRQFHWFCLDHVRAYNQAWDYFAGLGPEEIERCRREDAVWGRPTWPFSAAATKHEVGSFENFHDGFGFFREDAPRSRHGPAHGRRRAAGDPDLAALDLSPGADFDKVKARYKELVKALHPDANGNDRHAEERLKEVNRAYGSLRARFTRKLADPI